jgi:hypothetical protein
MPGDQTEYKKQKEKERHTAAKFMETRRSSHGSSRLVFAIAVEGLGGITVGFEGCVLEDCPVGPRSGESIRMEGETAAPAASTPRRGPSIKAEKQNFNWRQTRQTDRQTRRQKVPSSKIYSRRETARPWPPEWEPGQRTRSAWLMESS